LKGKSRHKKEKKLKKEKRQESKRRWKGVKRPSPLLKGSTRRRNHENSGRKEGQGPNTMRESLQNFKGKASESTATEEGGVGTKRGWGKKKEKKRRKQKGKNQQKRNTARSAKVKSQRGRELLATSPRCRSGKKRKRVNSGGGLKKWKTPVNEKGTAYSPNAEEEGGKRETRRNWLISVWWGGKKNKVESRGGVSRYKNAWEGKSGGRKWEVETKLRKKETAEKKAGSGKGNGRCQDLSQKKKKRNLGRKGTKTSRTNETDTTVGDREDKYRWGERKKTLKDAGQQVERRRGEREFEPFVMVLGPRKKKQQEKKERSPSSDCPTSLQKNQAWKSLETGQKRGSVKRAATRGRKWDELNRDEKRKNG